MLQTNLSKLALKAPAEKRDLREYFLTKNASIGQILMSPNIIKNINHMSQIQSDGDVQFVLDGTKIGAEEMQ